MKEDDNDQQRENIFHMHYHVQNKVCSLITESGSHTNVASTNLGSNMNLCTIKNYRPYRF